MTVRSQPTASASCIWVSPKRLRARASSSPRTSAHKPGVGRRRRGFGGTAWPSWPVPSRNTVRDLPCSWIDNGDGVLQRAPRLFSGLAVLAQASVHLREEAEVIEPGRSDRTHLGALPAGDA